MKTRLVSLLLVVLLSVCPLTGFAPVSVGVRVYPISYGDSTQFGYKSVDFGLDTSVIQRYSSAELPQSYDLRNYGRVTPVEDQKQYGICWAFSALKAGASALITAENGNGTDEKYDLSERHLAYFSFHPKTDNINDPTYGDDTEPVDDYLTVGGNWVVAASTLSRWSGAALESDFPFSENRYSMSCNEQDRYVNEYHLRSIDLLQRSDDIKNSIMQNGGVAVSYYADVYGFLSDSTGTYYCYTGKEAPSHMSVIVGWDDTVSYEHFGSSAPRRNGAWLVQNSWGNKWGDNGYFWLSYYDSSLTDFSSIVLTGNDDYDNNYTYNGSEPKSVYEFDRNSTSFAMQYTATGYQSVQAAAFYTLQENTSYTAKIYDCGFEQIKTQKPVTEKSGMIEHIGYHTIDFDTPCTIEKSSRFTIMLTLTANGAKTLCVPIESSLLCYGKAGRSFYYDEGKWHDSCLDEDAADLYIRLLTNNEQVQPGDVNADGNINAKDMLMLLKYLADWKIYPDMTGCDIYADDIVNAKDLLLLRRYLAGWDI